MTGRGVMPIAAVNAAKGTAWKEEMYELILSLIHISYSGMVDRRNETPCPSQVR